MKFTCQILIFIIVNLFIPSSPNIYNNPVERELDSNPIDYIIIVESKFLGNKANILKYHDYYLVTKKLYLVDDGSKNNLFLLADNKFYSLNEQNDEYIFKFEQVIGVNLDFYSFIPFDDCFELKSNKILRFNHKEIVLYAKCDNGNELNTYFINKNIMSNIQFMNSDE